EGRNASRGARALPRAKRPHPRHIDVARLRGLPARVDRNSARERPIHRGARSRFRGGAGIATLLIDASSLAYRAYHAMPEVRAPDGTLVNAVVGFLNFVARLLVDRRPAHLVVAMEFGSDWRPQFRVSLLPEYKSHRVATADTPPDEVE